MATCDTQVPEMDLHTTREPLSAVTNSVGTAAQQSRVAPLLRVPRELRDEIYGYFLAADMDWFSELESYTQAWWTDSSIVQINQQTRAEAWDYLIKRNLWVHVTLNEVNHQCGSWTFEKTLKWYPEFRSSSHFCDESSVCCRLYQPYFPLCEGGPPNKSLDVLSSEASVSLWLGETYDPNGNAAVDKSSTQITFMFAYEPSPEDTASLSESCLAMFPGTRA